MYIGKMNNVMLIKNPHQIYKRQIKDMLFIVIIFRAIFSSLYVEKRMKAKQELRRKQIQKSIYHDLG